MGVGNTAGNSCRGLSVRRSHVVALQRLGIRYAHNCSPWPQCGDRLCQRIGGFNTVGVSDTGGNS
jgi:hypothetical protein